MEQTIRKYPVGIQTFSEIIHGGYIYIDKTDLMWKLVNFAKYIFLGRPRCFGKSLLTSTLESYFNGDKELFKGLKIMSLEKEWKKYPVLHFDFSSARHLDIDDLRKEIGWQLSQYEETYGTNPNATSTGIRLTELINRIYEQTGTQVVVLIDGYDSPFVDILLNNDKLDKMISVILEFCQPLKSLEAKIKFCFITGVTKFPQPSIFSGFNNITYASLNPRFSAICGITEEELTTTLWQDVESLAGKYKVTPKAMHQRLKEQYAGYHFSEKSPEVYNPYSLMRSFSTKEIGDFWLEYHNPKYLIQYLNHFHTVLTSLDEIEVPETSFHRSIDNLYGSLPILYQGGFLTIKDFDLFAGIYTLTVPNREVRIGLTRWLLPFYTGLDKSDVQINFVAKFLRALKVGDINLAMQHMQAYLAGIPYVEGFKKKLAEASTKEGFYEHTFYLIFSMLNVYVRTQVKVAGGRTDIVVFMPDTIYVMELKVGDSAKNALAQINEKGYATPYLTDGRKVVKVGVRFNPDKHTVDEWVVE